MALSRFSNGSGVPPAIYRTTTWRNLENSATDYTFMVNEMVSYRKEIQYEGEVHNLVLVVQNFFDCDLDRAYDIVHTLQSARMAHFQHIFAHELPALYDAHHLDAKVSASLDRHVTVLQNWMCGVRHWHLETYRYGDDALAEHFAHRAIPQAPRLARTASAPAPPEF